MIHKDLEGGGCGLFSRTITASHEPEENQEKTSVWVAGNLTKIQAVRYRSRPLQLPLPFHHHSIVSCISPLIT
jgi:hypothetical protein